MIGRAIGDSAHTALISPDWDFKQMGIGGLDKEFSDIFRRAFASRVFPPDVVEQMGMKHVRGILLYGPPGECMVVEQSLSHWRPHLVDGRKSLTGNVD